MRMSIDFDYNLNRLRAKRAHRPDLSSFPGCEQELIYHLRKPIVHHPVTIAPESHLARVYSTTAAVVQSVHHQAVGRLGDGLRAVAWAEDGVVEAVESDRHDFVVAVQWHPELDVPTDERPYTLFDELVVRSRGFAELRRAS